MEDISTCILWLKAKFRLHASSLVRSPWCLELPQGFINNIAQRRLTNLGQNIFLFKSGFRAVSLLVSPLRSPSSSVPARPLSAQPWPPAFVTCFA